MYQYRYTLERSSRKFNCPQCSKKRFVRYIDSNTEEYLPEQYGRCDRETACSYHLNPYKDGYAKSNRDSRLGNNSRTMEPAKTVSLPNSSRNPVAFIPFEVLKETCQGWEQNTFIQNLLHRIPFPIDVRDIEKAIYLYYLGTVCNGYRAGAITLPFIDINKNIRTIQAKQFDETNHTISTDFLHAILEKNCKKKKESIPGWLEAYLQNDKKVSCLFGEHLLNKYPSSPIALVEAPKTAIIGTLYFGFPEIDGNMLWLAVYNLSSLSIEKCKVLQGRWVLLFPDLSKDGKAFNLWTQKAEELTILMPESRFYVSDFLEKTASEFEKAKGLDLADYLIKFDYRLFRK